MLQDSINKLKGHKYFLNEVEREIHGIPNQYLFKFPNGYGASVVPEMDYMNIPIINNFLDMNEEDLKIMTNKRLLNEFEIALFNKEGDLDFDNEIFSDVLRHQSIEQILNILNVIESLN